MPRQNKRRKKKVQKTCKTCGKRFWALLDRARYCGTRCRHAAWSQANATK